MFLTKLRLLIFTTWIAYLAFAPPLVAQTRPIAIVGATLIDGTGRAAVVDSAVVISKGRILSVGKRGEITIPQAAAVIDATGKSILPPFFSRPRHSPA